MAEESSPLVGSKNKSGGYDATNPTNVLRSALPRPGYALPRPGYDLPRPDFPPESNTLKENLADEYVRLSLQFESALIQHKLALQYFEFRAFYFVFLPVTIIATLITIIGFLISGSGTTQDGDDASGGSVEFEPLLTGNSKQIWSLVVGILGAISTLLNAIGKRTNYQSQSDMHRSAVKALEKICLTVDFERDWFDRNVRDIEYAGYEELTTKLGADLKTHQASFKAMLDACCDSPVPYQVDQAFTLLEQIVAQQVFGRENRGRASNLSPLTFYYHKLWKEHSTYWLWPLKAPSMKASKKYKEWKQEMEANYKENEMEAKYDDKYDNGEKYKERKQEMKANYEEDESGSDVAASLG
jgi:hypothetical protein